MLKKERNTVEEVVDFYKNVRKIKFHGNFKPKDIASIRDMFFIEKCRTYYLTDTLQCEEDRNRTFDDFLKICSYYFPEKPLKVIVKEFLDNEEKCADTLSVDFCPIVKRHNCWGVNGWHITDRINHHPLQFGFKRKFSFRQLMNY